MRKLHAHTEDKVRPARVLTHRWVMHGGVARYNARADIRSGCDRYGDREQGDERRQHFASKTSDAGGVEVSRGELSTG